MSHEKDRLIVSQQLRIQELEDYRERHELLKKHIHGLIVNMGGPLNDNKLGYSGEQKQIFFKINTAVSDLMT